MANTPRMIEIDGRRQTLKQWCDEVGIPPPVVIERVKYGWSWREAVLTPRREYTRRHVGPGIEGED